MSKHTPGPWILSFCDRFDDCQITTNERINKQTRPICVISDFYKGNDFENQFEKEQAANAHLIAAAPELLEALESVINDWLKRADCVLPKETCEKVIIAIAKAKGENNE